MRDRLIKLTWLLAFIAVAGLVVWAFMPQPVQVDTGTVAF
jgi:hypothetical protein